MKNQKLALLCLFAFLLNLVALIAGCSNKEQTAGTDTEKTATEETSVEETDILALRAQVSDDLPELDFHGADFRIFYQKRYTTDAVPEYESETGDILNDAVYRRNRSVEDRLNVRIVGIVGEEDAMVRTLMNSVAAGDNAYELFMGHSLYSGKAALAKCFYNWYDISYVDFSKPWFPQLAINGLTINGRMFLAVSDMCLSLVSNVYCMYFNKTIAADYGIPDMYTVVDEGRWTIDTLRELSKNVYEDLNGNNQKDDGDKFGFTSEITTTSATWVYACDQKTVEFGEDGSVTSVFNCERTQNIVEKLKALFYDTPGVIAKDISFDKADEIFMQGRALFVSSSLGKATGVFRELLFDYGILPYPKFDEAQKIHRTIAGGSVSCIAVPVTVDYTDMSGAVTTALCRESWV